MSALQSSSGEQKANQMGIVRKQVTTLLGSAQQGEVSTMTEFLNTFAESSFAEEHQNSEDKSTEEGKSFQLSMIKQEALRNFKDGHGRCAIHFASTSNAPGCDSVVEEILKIMPSAHELRDEKGATPLVLAAGMADDDVSLKMVDILLKAGADCKASDFDGVQAIHQASAGGKCTIVEILFKAGAPLDVCSMSGAPLHWAAGEGRHLVVEQLLRLGASADIVNAQGITPIIMAAARGADKCVAILARAGACVNKSLASGLTVLHIAADVGLPDGVEALLESPEGRACALARDDASREPIHLAAAAGHEAIVKMLIPHTYQGMENTPTLAQLMADGGKAALEHDRLETEKAAAELASKAIPSHFIENTKPASNPEDAASAKKAKDEGNAYYVAKDHLNAITKYTEAIRLDGSDPVFFSNRSACWLELGKQEQQNKQTVNHEDDEPTDFLKRALADAEHCRHMRPDWAKGCFRLAAARLALNMFEDAAVAAYEGLKIDESSAGLKKIMKEAVDKGREEHFRNQKK